LEPAQRNDQLDVIDALASIRRCPFQREIG
jgi:hypothetical protein